MPSEIQFKNLLQVLDKHKDTRVIFTKANADTDGRIINKMIDEYVEVNKDRCIAFTSLGQVRYLSTLQFCKAIVGNSSSGIIEAPSFYIPTVNIGNRQLGRIAAKTVVHCGYSVEEIEGAMGLVMTKEYQEDIKGRINPYEGCNTSRDIVEIIVEFLSKKSGIKKRFYDIRF